MTKGKNTMRALCMSILSMLLCAAMLAGSTFAWFTDSVNSGQNRIIAGNLDVQLFYKTGGMTDWRDVESLGPGDADPFFRSAGGNRILWEPGAIGVTSFKVENAGTLAFKYAIALLAVKYNQLDGRDLRDVIKFAVIDGELPEDATAEYVQNLTNFSAFSDFTKRSALRPKDGDNAGKYQEIFTVVAYWKPNSDSTDNLYNVNVAKGKIATELDGTQSNPNQLYLDIDVRLNAWQDTVEDDSFDNQYDAMADALDTFPDGCYAVTEHESWVELDIYTGRSTADIHISYPGYAPDNTDDRMRTWKTGESGTITPAAANGDTHPAANGNTHLIFFKTADKGSFVLTQEGRVLSKLTVQEDETLRQSRIVYSARNAVAAMAMSTDLSNAISVSTEAGMLDVIRNLNANGGETTVKLSGDIEITDEWRLNNGTLTILGEGHSVTARATHFVVTGTAKLNLGADGYGQKLTVCASDQTTLALIEVGSSACVNIYEGTVIDGSAAPHSSQSGGVEMSGNATVTMYGGTIQNCSSLTTGGGVAMLGSAKFNMNGGEIKNCQGLYGGAVGMTDANLMGATGDCNAVFTMNGGTISNCSSVGAPASGWGGSSYTVGGAAVCMYGTSTNYSASYKGQFIMNGGSITGCSTNATNAQGDVYGGAIFVSAGTVTLNKGEIIGNTVTAGNGKSAYGGGIACYCIAATTITIENNFKLYNNSAETAGDDIANVASSNTYGTLKLKNAKTSFGGPLYSEQTGGTWYTDAAGKRCKDDKGTEIKFTAPSVDQTVAAKTYPYIKVVHEEEPEPVLVTITFIIYGVEGNYAQYTLELGAPIPDPGIPVVEGRVFNRWLDESGDPVAATAEKDTIYHADTCPLEGFGTPGRLLDLYNGTNNSAAISKGGAKTVTWHLEHSDLANRVNADAPIAAGTKITMAYYPDENDRTKVEYYYLIVSKDTTSVSLSDFIAMGGSKHFVNVFSRIWNPIYQFSFVFPETQENMNIWMCKTKNDALNGTAVKIAFSENRVSAPSGTLTANGNTVTVSGLTGFEADQSDSRHNTLQPLANRKAVLAVEAVDAQGRTVAMSGDTIVTVGGSQAKVSAGIAAAEITEGAYTIKASALPQDAVKIRVSLCYTDNSVIHKPMANVLDSVTVKP